MSEGIFYSEGREALLAWAAHRSCGYPVPRGAQGQVGWGSGQPDLVAGNPAHSRGAGAPAGLRAGVTGAAWGGRAGTLARVVGGSAWGPLPADRSDGWCFSVL